MWRLLVSFLPMKEGEVGKNRGGGRAPLFVYGTLKDADMRIKLFDEEVPFEEGLLVDHELRGGGGFLFVRPRKGHEVRGLLLRLSKSQLGRADQWEDVPLYSREWAKVVDSGGETIDSWVYLRRGIKGVTVLVDEVSLIPREMVLKLIKDFRANR